MAFWAAVAVGLAAAALAASSCSTSDAEPKGYDYRSEGALLYAEQCQVCHGEAGQGGLAVALVDGDYDATALSDVITATMPKNEPERCVGECADLVADFIVEGLRTEELACQSIAPSPRRLRLLTRREYGNTVADLLQGLAPQGCEVAMDCGFRQRCEAQLCEQEVCNQHSFVFDAGSRTPSSVHIAGSFNGWPASAAQGGLALQSAANGLWVGRFEIPEGNHTYKIVVDDSEWLTDPRALERSPDGFGGENSVLALSCDGGNGFDPARAFPPEVRPDGFAFETHADSALVNASALDAQLDAADVVGADAASRMLAEPGCQRDDACAQDFIRRFAERGFRRALTDGETAGLLALVQDAESFEEGLRTVAQAVLISPSFLYRSELGTKDGGVYPLTAYERATALSYTLWGTMPDSELWALAESGELVDSEVFAAQARRLLDDSRSRPSVESFASQWLGAEAIRTVDKNANLFPGLDEELRRDMLSETRRFVSNVIFEGTGALQELFTADYSVASPRLAAHYGLSADTEGRMSYANGNRSGILGHASILGTTAHSDQTSPIRRGLFVRRRLLCQELPPPPPFAGGVPEVDANATTRERFAMHTSNEVCAGCHKLIDGVGFGFEQFDAVGRYRENEAGKSIDASGTITDLEALGMGTTENYSSIPELASKIGHSEAAASCFVRQYFRFARGYREGLADRCAREWLEERFSEREFDVKELLIDMVLSPDFVVRQ